MTTVRLSLKALMLMAFMLAFSALANAQATRTWVSGVGDDVNPCSRTAPCKTFAGAISKTFIGGEIDALDDGGFGTVTITKSITLDGGNHNASILASGTNGVNVNFTTVNANDPEKRVTIRRLTINGTGSSGAIGQRTGVRGINITTPSAMNVFVENCYIQNFLNEGINTSGVTATSVFVSVKDTNITNCATGINITTSTGFAVASLEHVRIEKMSGNGLNIATHGHAHVRDSFIVNNGGDGISMAAGVTDGTVNVESTMIASSVGAGIRNGGTGSVVDISNTSLLQNASALATASGAAGGGINSHGNNQINGPVGTTPNPVGQQ